MVALITRFLIDIPMEPSQCWGFFFFFLLFPKKAAKYVAWNIQITRVVAGGGGELHLSLSEQKIWIKKVEVTLDIPDRSASKMLGLTWDI